MTPNIIDEAVERLDFACATESKINTGDVALLLKAFKTSRRMVREQIAQLDAANARIAELEQAIEDSAYSPIEIMPLEDAFDTLTEYFHDVLLWNEPEFVEGRAAVDTVRFAINEYDKRIAELEAWKAAVPVESIAFCVDAADYTYDVMWAEAKAWIDAQPQPTPSPE